MVVICFLGICGKVGEMGWPFLSKIEGSGVRSPGSTPNATGMEDGWVYFLFYKIRTVVLSQGC